MRALVTGGAGFIGSHIVETVLRESANEVVIFDNLSSGRSTFIAAATRDPRCTFISGDLLDADAVRRAMSSAKPDIVFHLAANPDIARGALDPSLDFQQTAVATFHVLEAMRLARTPRLVFTSGSGVYGDHPEVATAETFGPLLPISMYGASKLAAEAMISSYAHMYGLTAYVFRFANVVGGGQTHGVAFDFIRKLRANPHRLEVLGDGNQSKSYVHVSDVVSAILFVLEKEREPVNLYNVATDDYVTVRWIADRVRELMELPHAELAFAGGARGWSGDVPVVRFDLSKIHGLGWAARLSSRDAIARSIAEMLSDPAGPAPIGDPQT
jgi:UDP-glucose 4-epimerase